MTSLTPRVARKMGDGRHPLKLWMVQLKEDLTAYNFHGGWGEKFITRV